MHLLSFDEDGELSLTKYEDDQCPPYAILSHTWYADEDEVNYHDVLNGRGKNKPGRDKIVFCGNQARKDDLKHFWVDSCCIDKTSSAELSESLNCMVRWYQNAKKCYVYLSDVEMMQGDSHQPILYSWETTFQNCRWFTRGWTLQELLAPKLVEFWSRDRYMLGTKITLSNLIHNRTGIPLPALEGAPMSNFSVDERFRWAASRETRRIEDKAYCLLGIFEVYIPPIYGEGNHSSERLQTAIRQKLRLLAKQQNIANQDVDETLRKHRKTLLDSLSFQELGSRQASIRNAYRTTCEWVLEHPTYAKWSHSDRKTFWIVGKPGAGKSTLMKLLHSKARWAKSEYEFVFGFFFNARGNTLEKTTNGMYRALLFELFQAFPELQSILDERKCPAEWTLHSLKHVLSDVVQKIGPRSLRLFIDALDECDEQEIQEMVDHMEEIEGSLSKGGGMLSICFASRHYPSITIRNGVRMNLDEAAGHLDDLDIYIEQRLQIEGEGTLVHEICGEVRRKANGVFLWAVLVIDILNKEIRRGRMRHIKSKLEEIPIGLSALFMETLARDEEDMGEFRLCIQWILFAARPLSLVELYFAMESGLHDHSSADNLWQPKPWDRERVTTEQMKRFLQSSSKGLAETIQSTERPSNLTVQFIHESVRDFFLKDGHLETLLPESGGKVRSRSHEKLKDCCLNYLGPNTSVEIQRVEWDALKVSDVYPFLHYANNNILYHANEAAHEVSQNRLFELYPNAHHVNIANCFYPSTQYFDESKYSSTVTLLYLAAERNFWRLVTIAKEKGQDMWQRHEGEQWRYAVIAAFINGHRETLEVLLDGLEVPFLDGIVQDPLFGKRGNVPTGWYHEVFDRGLLVWASECSNWSLAESLTRVNAPSRILLGSTYGQLGVPVPSNIDRLQVLEYLLRHVPWFNAGLALVSATREEQTAIIQCITNYNNELKCRRVESWESAIKYCFFPFVPDGLPRTTNSFMMGGFGPHSGRYDSVVHWEDFMVYALKLAIIEDCMASVRVLLESGMNVNVESGGYHPLQVASAVGTHTIVCLLLDSGADIDVHGQEYGTSLAAACYERRFGIAELLLRRGANVNATDGYHKTALRVAARWSLTDVMCLLLDWGADVDALSGSKRATALQSASRHGREKVIRFLLDRGADVNADGECYGAALQAAALQYSVECPEDASASVVELLLEHGAEINAVSTLSRGVGHALAAASYSGREDIVSVLLDRGANVNLYGPSTGTALYHACSQRNYEIAKLLVDRGADIGIGCRQFGSALAAAAGHGASDIVSMLLDRGADINARGESTGTALFYACQCGHEDTAGLLINRGADVNMIADRELPFKLLVKCGGTLWQQ